MSTITVTTYVQHRSLIAIDTNEHLRRATASERRASRAESSGTGAIAAQVAERTVRRAAPRYVAGMLAYRGWL